MNSAVSIILFSIGIGIISLVIQGEKWMNEQFSRNLAGIDLVVGAKGSPVQLILSSVFHIDTPTGNISMSEAEQIMKNPLVRKSVPISLGDNHNGHRIIGTTPEYGAIYGARILEGKWFEKAFEAVIGSETVRRTGLKKGDHFTGQHGFSVHGHHHDEDMYTVTGVLEKTGTVIDGVILTTVDTYWLIHGHETATDDHGNMRPESDMNGSHTTSSPDHTQDMAHGHTHDETSPARETQSAMENHSGTGEQPSTPVKEEPCSLEGCDHDHHDEEAAWEVLIRKMDAQEDISSEEMALYRERTHQIRAITEHPGKEITALLVFYSTPRAAVQLPGMINDNTSLQAASPAFETHRLFTLVGTGVVALQWLAWIIIAISALNLFIHLSNTLNQSMFEIALIRSLGAGRMKVMTLLILQGLWLAVAGGIVGLLLAKFILITLTGSGEIPGGTISAVTLHDLTLMGYAAVAGVVASIQPAIRAYKSDIHYILMNEG